MLEGASATAGTGSNLCSSPVRFASPPRTGLFRTFRVCPGDDDSFCSAFVVVASATLIEWTCLSSALESAILAGQVS